MWKASKEGVNLLQNWLNENGDEKLMKKCETILRQDTVIFDHHELETVLKSLSEKFPIYQFIDRIMPYVPEIAKEVNPEYEARLERLRRQQEEREYNEMIRSIYPNRPYSSENMFSGFAKEMKLVNRQLMVIANTLLTVAGGFVFGYFGIGYAYPSLNLDVAIRMALGLLIATAVFIADLYFIIKSLDDFEEKPVKARKVSEKHKNTGKNVAVKKDK